VLCLDWSWWPNISGLNSLILLKFNGIKLFKLGVLSYSNTREIRQLDSPLARGGKATRAALAAVKINAFHGVGH
jgi:hypothetical protein